MEAPGAPTEIQERPLLTESQVKGAILEEAVLHLLKSSGYEPVTSAGNDPTLEDGPAGLCIKGRGASHQVDAIADFVVKQPLALPRRLLVEAKAHGKRTGLDVIRNVVGVLKDISEHWRGQAQRRPFRQPFQYHYVVVSTADFTSDAQAYAYAQGIHLVPLKRSAFARSLLDAVNAVPRAIKHDANYAELLNGQAVLRQMVRAVLRSDESIHTPEAFRRLAEAATAIGGVLFGVAGNGVSVFLVPRDATVIRSLGSEDREIRVRVRSGRWFVTDASSRVELFSLELPTAVLSAYEADGMLDAATRSSIKGDLLQSIQVLVAEHGVPRIVTLRTDERWLARILEVGRAGAGPRSAS